MIISALLLMLGMHVQADVTDNSTNQADLNAFSTDTQQMDLLNIEDPRPPPFYGYVYGPKRTLSWYDYGTNRIPKILSESTVINTDNRLVNEIVLRAMDNRINVQSVRAYTIDGRVIELRQLTGDLRGNMQKRASVDRYYSVRLERIEIVATSPNLIGSRGELQVFLGLAE